MNKSEYLRVLMERGMESGDEDGMVVGESEKFVEMVLGEKRKVERTIFFFKRTPFS